MLNTSNLERHIKKYSFSGVVGGDCVAEEAGRISSNGPLTYHGTCERLQTGQGCSSGTAAFSLPAGACLPKPGGGNSNNNNAQQYRRVCCVTQVKDRSGAVIQNY